MHISPDEIEKHITDDDPKPLISSTKAAERFDITNDYVTLLCRQKKINGSLIGRMWYVEPESLQKFLKEVRAKKSEQNAALAAKFKEERKKVIANTLVPAVPVLDETPKKNLVISPAVQASSRKKIRESVRAIASLLPVPSAQFAGRTMALASLYIVAATSTYALQVKMPEPIMQGYLSFLDGVGEIQADAYRDLGKGIAFALDTSTKAMGVDDNVAAVVGSEEKLESPFFGFSIRDTWNRFLALFERGDTHYALQTSEESDANTTYHNDAIGDSIYGITSGGSSVSSSGRAPSVPAVSTAPPARPASAPTTVVNNYNTYPVVERVVTTSGSTLPAETYISILSEFSRTLRSEMSRSIGESIANSRRGSGKLTLTAGDIPDLSGSYLSLAGGDVTGDVSVSGRLGVGTTSPSDTLALQGALYLAQISTPSNTLDRLYNEGGDLYFAGNLIGGGSTGTWDSDGTNVWRSGGNVGIGTSSPLGDIHVHSGLPDVAGTIYLSNSLTGARDQIGTYSPLGEIWFGSTEAVSYQAAGIRAVGGWGVNQDFNTNDTPAHLIFLTTPNNSSVAQERLMITSGGMVLIGYGDNPQIEGTGGINESPGSLIVNRNIGIGTTSPYARLSVVGPVAAEYYVATSTTATSTFAGGFSVGSTNFNVLQNGNVGIGTASPSSKLQLRTIANEAQTLTLSGDYYNGGVTTNTNVILSQFQRGNTGVLQDSGKIIFGKETIWNTLNDIDGYIAFQTTQNQTLTEHLRITSAGNVGIGTTTPQSRLSVVGTALTGSAATSAFDLSQTWNTSGTPTALSVNVQDTSSNAASLLMNLMVSGENRFSVRKDGRVIISNQSVSSSFGSSFVVNGPSDTAGRIALGFNEGSPYLGMGPGNTTRDMFMLRDVSDIVSFAIWNPTENDGGKLSIYAEGYGTENFSRLHFKRSNALTTDPEEPFVMVSVGQGTEEPSPIAFRITKKDSSGETTWFNDVLYLRADSASSSAVFSGNVGIGTTSPYAKLSVVGDVVAPRFIATSTAATSTFAGGIQAACFSVDGTTCLQGGPTSLDGLSDAARNGSSIFIGTSAGANDPGDASNIGFGNNALGTQNNGSANVAIGSNSLSSGNDINQIVAIGHETFLNLQNTTGSVAVGAFAGQGSGAYTASGLALFGYQAGNSLQDGASNNTLIGYSSGYGITTGMNNTLIGYAQSVDSRNQVTTGSGNIAIGYNVAVPSQTASGQLSIGNLIYGTGLTGTGYSVSTGSIGIGTTSPQEKLHIAGNLRLDSASDTSVQFYENSTGRWSSSYSVAGDYLYMRDLQNSRDLLRLYDNGNAVFLGEAGNVGIGTTSPYAKLSVVGEVAARNFTATSTSATTTIAGGLNVGSGAINHDFSTGVTSINNLAVGSWNFETDSGIVTWTDMPVTSALPADTAVSYSANIAGTSVLTVYAESTGSGGAQNFRVGIGTTTPYASLSVSGRGMFESDVYASHFTATSSTASQFPYASTTMITATTASTTNLILSALGSAAGQCLTTDASGTVTSQACGGGGGGLSFDYPFPSNATSTTLTFNAGLLSLASTTIGDGTQVGGLTISGGATTTGNQVISGSLIVGDSSSGTGVVRATGIGSFAGGYRLTCGNGIYATQPAAFAFGYVQAPSGGCIDGGKIEATASGNVAMGRASGNGGIIRASGNGGGSIAMGHAAASRTLQSSGNNGSIALGYANATNLTSTGIASVAIGEDVNATANNAFALGKSFTNNTASTFQVGFSATPTLTVTASNVGIGTTSPWRTLSINGTVAMSGLTGATGAGSLCLDSNSQVVYNSASDSCLPSLRETKDKISDLSLDALDILEALDPVSFIYTWDTSSTTRYGFIAEDVALIDKHLATYNAEGEISGIDDRSLLAILIKGFKDLIARIDSFAMRFTTQELCVGSVCVTEEEFLAIVEAAGIDDGDTANIDPEPEEPQEEEPIEEEPIVEEPTPEDPTEEPVEEEPAPEEPVEEVLTEETPTEEETAPAEPVEEPAE